MELLIFPIILVPVVVLAHIASYGRAEYHWDWHDWYAWRPVWCGGRFVWRETIQRVIDPRTSDEGGGMWLYKVKEGAMSKSDHVVCAEPGCPYVLYSSKSRRVDVYLSMDDSLIPNGDPANREHYCPQHAKAYTMRSGGRYYKTVEVDELGVVVTR